MVATAVVAVASLVARWRGSRHDAVARQQLKWLLVGAGATVALFALAGLRPLERLAGKIAGGRADAIIVELQPGAETTEVVRLVDQLGRHHVKQLLVGGGESDAATEVRAEFWGSPDADVIAGLLEPTAGRIHLDGDDITDLPSKKRDLAMVFQSYALYPHLSVRKNLAFPLKTQRLGAAEIATRVQEVADSLEIGHLLDVFTFLEVEKAIARGLRDRVIASADAVNAAEVREIAGRRQDGHWVSGKVAPSVEVPRTALHAVYDALVSAADFFELKGKYRGGFDHADAAALYHAYESELFRFDQLYRHFCEAADLALAQARHTPVAMSSRKMDRVNYPRRSGRIHDIAAAHARQGAVVDSSASENLRPRILETRTYCCPPFVPFHR